MIWELQYSKNLLIMILASLASWATYLMKTFLVATLHNKKN